jgi:hypothetical protein
VAVQEGNGRDQAGRTGIADPARGGREFGGGVVAARVGAPDRAREPGSGVARVGVPEWSGSRGERESGGAGRVAVRGDGAVAGSIGDRARVGVPFGPVGVVFCAVGVAVVAMLVLHLRGAGRLDPVTTTVSDYVSLPGGSALLTLATLAIAVATAAIPIGLVRARVPNVAGLCLLFGLGCAGLLASVAFPTNALGAAVSLDTVLHRYAAGLFFVSLPIAAVFLLRRLPSQSAALLTYASVLAGVAFLGSHLPLAMPALPDAHLLATLLPRGIVERVLLAADLALLVGLARRVAR